MAAVRTTQSFELLEILSDVACHEAERTGNVIGVRHHVANTSPSFHPHVHYPESVPGSQAQSLSPPPPPHVSYPRSTVRVLAAPRSGGVRKTSFSGASSGSNDGCRWKGRSTPSRFCHICSRTAKKVSLLPCANLASGACRKVVCEKCFVEFGWDWEAASAARGTWQCTHCRRVCPRRAQCAIYRRTNERRREQQQQARARLQHIQSIDGGQPLFGVLPTQNIATNIAPRIAPALERN